MTDDPIKAAFAANPDHPMAKALRAFRNRWPGDPDRMREVDAINGAGLATGDLAEAIDNYLPQPTFGERVLAHLPEGWSAVATVAQLPRSWRFILSDEADTFHLGFSAIESSDPAAVAGALLLLAGEKR